jgi:hypothetical protein
MLVSEAWMSKQLTSIAASSVDGEWPERLRRGVRSALQRCQIEHNQWFARELDVHHIVAAGLDGAAPGRRLLARWSISVHSIVNAAIIPRSFHQGQGLHRQEFLHTINMRLSSAALFAEAVLPHGGFAAGRLIMLQTIQKIGIELAARSEDAAALRLQDALQILITRSVSAGGSAGGMRADGGARVTARSGRERFHVSGSGARLESAPVSRTRRPSFQHASACP